MHAKNNFDFLRFVAAAAVIVGHSYPLSGREYAADIIFFGAGIHTWGVMVFFVISGYLITASWMSGRDLGGFFLKRGLRIFPALFVVVLLSAFVLGPLISSIGPSQYMATPFTWRYLLNVALYPIYNLPGVFGENPYPNAVNGSLWTLPVEFFMYILTPFLAVIASRKAHAALLLVATCAIYGIGWLMWQPDHAARVVIYGTDLRAALSVAGYFTAGALFRLVGTRLRFNLGYAIAVMAVLAVAWKVVPSYRPMWGLLQIFVVTYLVLSIAFSKVVPFQHFGKYGDFSYGLYLYAFPIQQLIMWVDRDLPPPLFATIALVITLPFAIASWHLIEKRMLSLKDRLSQRRQALQRHPASI